MRIGVGMDGDGHFRVALYDERGAMVSLLQSLQDGDYFDNIIDDYTSEHNIYTEDDGSWREFVYALNDDDWFVFLSQFTQRGTFELLDI